MWCGTKKKKTDRCYKYHELLISVQETADALFLVFPSFQSLSVHLKLNIHKMDKVTCKSCWCSKHVCKTDC